MIKRSKPAIPGLSDIELKTIIGYLTSDLNDDWFQDPHLFADILNQNETWIHIERNYKENFGRYVGSFRESFHIPKQDFTLRYSAETPPIDRIMYYFLTLPLAELFDPLISRRVFSYRLADSPAMLFYNGVNQWDKFEGVTRFRSQGRLILETDIQNFYENISIDILANDLESLLMYANPKPSILIEIRHTINELISNLRKWSYDRMRGLPQNRDCSAVLANLYLKPVDDIMISKGYDYYRYMDDIRIIVNDHYHGRKALIELTLALRERHLSINGKKTHWIPHNPVYSENQSGEQVKISNIDALLQTKKSNNISIAYKQIKKAILTELSKVSIDGKIFRFCLSRLTKLSRCYDYNLPPDFWDELKLPLAKFIRDNPSDTYSVYQFLSASGLNSESFTEIKTQLLDPNVIAYEWQRYWLWKLVLSRAKPDLELLSHSRWSISTATPSLDASAIPGIAGAVIYLGCFGNSNDLVLLETLDLSSSIFLTRHIGIAKRRSRHHARRAESDVELNDEIHTVDISEYITKPSKLSISKVLMDIQPYG